MLKRPCELISQSNFKSFYTASDTYRSLQSFCNYKKSGIWSQTFWSQKQKLFGF
jgi:hypothetical protein